MSLPCSMLDGHETDAPTEVSLADRMKVMAERYQQFLRADDHFPEESTDGHGR